MKHIAFILIICSLLSFYPFKDMYADDSVDKYINKMTIGQKIGQLVLMGFQGRSLNKQDIAHIKKIHPGGIVFYARNFNDASDVAPFIEKITSVFKNNEVPMFFAIDQEGGIVHRIEGEYFKPPSAPSIGAAYSEEIAREVGRSIGSTLRNLGININLAPVLDMPSDILSSQMTLRSYSNDSKIVEKLGVAYINGLKEAGLLSTAKHFPGIGRANKDPHHILQHIAWGTQDEKDNDIEPFKGAIKAGVDIIMVGHFIAEPGDAKNPISLSSYWMKDMLRKDIGFDGLIMMDDIEMKAIKDIMPIPEAAIRSFNAGADIIIISHERKNQEEVFNALLDAVKKGRISKDRLKESLRRIITLKMIMMSYNKSNVVGKNLKDVSSLVARNSVVALKLKDAPPLNISKEASVLYIGYNLTLFNAFEDFFRHTENLNTTLMNYKKIRPEINIAEFIKNFDAIIIDADYSNASGIISICNDLNLKYVMVLSHPWNILRTLERFKPEWIVITFENSRVHFKTAAEIICGIRQAKGRLPYKLILPADYAYFEEQMLNTTIN